MTRFMFSAAVGIQKISPDMDVSFVSLLIVDDIDLISKLHLPSKVAASLVSRSIFHGVAVRSHDRARLRD